MRCKKLGLFKDTVHNIMNRFLEEKAQPITKPYFQNLDYQYNSGVIPVNEQNGSKSYREVVEFVSHIAEYLLRMPEYHCVNPLLVEGMQPKYPFTSSIHSQ
jgi:hypothetical protein